MADRVAAGAHDTVRSVLRTLVSTMCESANPHQRRGGLVGLSAVAAGLQHRLEDHLDVLLPAVLTHFTDADGRVRVAAAEAACNIVTKSGDAILPLFNVLFIGVAKLSTDVEPDVKHAVSVLDLHLRSVVRSSSRFDVASFLPVLADHARSGDSYMSLMVLEWVSALESSASMTLVDNLPIILPGLFSMLSDANREVKNKSYSVLELLLQSLAAIPHEDLPGRVKLADIAQLLATATLADEKFTCITALQWVAGLVDLAGSNMLPALPDLARTVISQLSDEDEDVMDKAYRANDMLIAMVGETKTDFDARELMDVVVQHLPQAEVVTRSECLRWVELLIRVKPKEIQQRYDDVVEALLYNCTDDCDAEVLKYNIDVLALLCNLDPVLFYNSTLARMVTLFASSRALLEARGAFIIRRLCQSLSLSKMFLALSRLLRLHPSDAFACIFVELLNLILLTAAESAEFRSALRPALRQAKRDDVAAALAAESAATANMQAAQSVQPEAGDDAPASAAWSASAGASSPRLLPEIPPVRLTGAHSAEEPQPMQLFCAMFLTWCVNPMACVALCLMTGAYDTSAEILTSLAERQITTGTMLQADRLVQLIESPVFVSTRMLLVQPAARGLPALLRALFALLMLLPQSQAYTTLQARLSAACTLHSALAHAGGAPPPVRLSRDSSHTEGAEQDGVVALLFQAYEQCTPTEAPGMEDMIASLREICADTPSESTSPTNAGTAQEAAAR